MTTSNHSQPGRVLLKVAPLIFHDTALASAVHPTIADLREEWREAGSTRERLLARWRGYVAFWALVLRAPYAFPRATTAMPHAGIPDAVDSTGLALIALASVALLWLAAGPWALALLAGSLLVAVPVHVWQRRHPARLRAHTRGRQPEINISGIQVGGDVGGLIFVVGSVAIVIAGIPMVRWFLLGVVLVSLPLAWSRARQHRTDHPDAPGHLSVACR